MKLLGMQYLVKDSITDKVAKGKARAKCLIIIYNIVYIINVRFDNL